MKNTLKFLIKFVLPVLILVIENTNIYAQNTISFNNELPLKSSDRLVELENIKILLHKSDSMILDALSYRVNVNEKPYFSNEYWHFHTNVEISIDQVKYEKFKTFFTSELSRIALTKDKLESALNSKLPINSIFLFKNTQASEFYSFENSIAQLNLLKDFAITDVLIYVYTDTCIIFQDINESITFIKKSLNAQELSDSYEYKNWYVGISPKNNIGYSCFSLINPKSFEEISNWLENTEKFLWSFSLKSNLFNLNGATLSYCLRDKNSVNNPENINSSIKYFDYRNGTNSFRDNFRITLAKSYNQLYNINPTHLFSPFEEINIKSQHNDLYQTYPRSWNLAYYEKINFPLYNCGESSGFKYLVDNYLIENPKNEILRHECHGKNCSIDGFTYSFKILNYFPTLDKAIIEANNFFTQNNNTILTEFKNDLTKEHNELPLASLSKSLFIQLNFEQFLTSNLISKITLDQKFNEADLQKLTSLSIEKAPLNSFVFDETNIPALKSFMNYSSRENREITNFLDSILKINDESIFLNSMTTNCSQYVSEIIESRLGYSDLNIEEVLNKYKTSFDTEHSNFTQLLETGNCGWINKNYEIQRIANFNNGEWYYIYLEGKCSEESRIEEMKIIVKVIETPQGFKIANYAVGSGVYF